MFVVRTVLQVAVAGTVTASSGLKVTSGGATVSADLAVTGSAAIDGYLTAQAPFAGAATSTLLEANSGSVYGCGGTCTYTLPSTPSSGTTYVDAVLAGRPCAAML
jgi:hypothetical protein